MSAFTETSFERKLAELNPTQQSIQAVSNWLIHHRKHHEQIAKNWYKEFRKAQEHRKLTFIYLANDVIQNGRKKGSEFGKSFAPIIKKALEHMAKINEEKTKTSLFRILDIWMDRGIYDPKVISEYKAAYQKAWDDLHDEEYVDALLDGDGPAANSDTAEANSSSRRSDGSDSSRRRRDSEGSSRRQGHRDRHEKSKRPRMDENVSVLRKSSLGRAAEVDEIEADGVVQLEVKLSPSPYQDPPTEEELIKMIKDLEKMPSTDAVIRGKIANLPPEVSDVGKIDELCTDSDVARALLQKIDDAAQLLNDYNAKLDAELEDRKAASMRIQDFLNQQSDLLTQAEQRLEEHQGHHKTMQTKIDDLKSHIASMPDFSKLPSVTDGLAPLPSAGDLFSL